MKVLITAGGTCEDIDSVRSITNHSTGRLGSIIADKFAHENATVTYVCGEKAALPSSENIEIIRIRNVEGLQQALDELLERHLFDCVIHSMAVSDFTPLAVLTVDDIVKSLQALDISDSTQEELSDKIYSAVTASAKPLNKSKISSRHSDLMILLRQTPKIIKGIKAKQPSTILVGFKLLVDVSKDELLQTAKDFLTQNSCDFVLANDLQNIHNDSHKAILVDINSVVHKASTKQEIATTIYSAVSERINK